jgi:hypothetical protein
MSKLVGFLYFLMVILTLIFLVTLVPGCASLHDPTWDIEPRPESKRSDLLTPKEVSQLQTEYPEAFLPALPVINERVEPSPVKVAPKYGWSVYRHQAGQPELLQLPLIILDIDPEIPAPDGPST